MFKKNGEAMPALRLLLMVGGGDTYFRIHSVNTAFGISK